MDDLNLQQQAFVAKYVENGGNGTQAYLDAYGCSYDTAAANAARALKDPKIITAIEAIRGPVAKRAGLTLERHLKNLAKLRDEARKNKQYAPAVSAEIARGKAAGLYVERVRVEDVTKLSDDELEAIIRRGQMRVA